MTNKVSAGQKTFIGIVLGCILLYNSGVFSSKGTPPDTGTAKSNPSVSTKTSGTTPSSGASNNASSTSWEFSKEKDEVRGVVYEYASLRPLEEYKDPETGRERNPKLIIKRDSPDHQASIYINVDDTVFYMGCVDGDLYSSPDERMTVFTARFDSDAPVKLKGCHVNGQPGNIVLQNPGDSLLQKILSAKVLHLAADPYEEPEKILTFRTAGLGWTAPDTPSHNSVASDDPSDSNPLESILDIEQGSQQAGRDFIDAGGLTSSNNEFHGLRVHEYQAQYDGNKMLSSAEIYTNRNELSLKSLLNTMGEYCGISADSWNRTNDDYENDSHVGLGSGSKCDVNYDTTLDGRWRIMFSKKSAG